MTNGHQHVAGDARRQEDEFDGGLPETGETPPDGEDILPEDNERDVEPGDQSGEDEGGSPKEGRDDHLKEDQKPKY